MKDLFVELAQLAILHGHVCEAAERLRGAMGGSGVTETDDVEAADAAFNSSLITLGNFAASLMGANVDRKVGISFPAEESPAAIASPASDSADQPENPS